MELCEKHDQNIKICATVIFGRCDATKNRLFYDLARRSRKELRKMETASYEMITILHPCYDLRISVWRDAGRGKYEV